MHDDERLEQELDKLTKQLPEALQKDWMIVPKRTSTQVFVVGLSFGAAATLMFVGFALDNPNLRMVWPATIVILMISTKWLPWWRGDDHKVQLSRAIDSEERQAAEQQN